MITHPLILLAVLLVIEIIVLKASKHPKTKKFFKFLPAVFWIYFLPMLVSSAGLIDPKSPLYGYVIDYGLPACLFMLLIGVDLNAVARMGRTVILMFLAGSLGIMIGTVIVFTVFHAGVGAEYASGFAALSASWMGGSANMVAVKEAVGTPDDVFLPMVVVDTIVPYIWMGFLIYCSTFQEQIDRFNKADLTLLDEIRGRVNDISEKVAGATNFKKAAAITVLAAGISWGLNAVAHIWPVIPGVISAFTWTVILVSVIGLAGSLTKLSNYGQESVSRSGYFILYFVLTTIGAKANVSHLGDSVLLIGMGFLIVIIHGIVLMAAARLLRAPVMIAAAASQANMGGAASAPIVAAVYQPGLAPIGLLMAVLGSILGTYFGIIVGQVCRLITS